MRHLIIVLILIINNSVFSQEPPPSIKFSFKKLAVDTTQLFKKYEFRTFVYRESILPVKNQHLDLKSYAVEKDGKSIVEKVFEYERGNFNITDNLISFSVNGHRPNINDVILLSIRNIESQKYLNIYLRTCYLMDFGEEILLKELSFKSGTYFYDMCKSKKRFEIPCQKKYETKISLEETVKHKVSINKLNRLIKNKNCNLK
jgi:hypothetical protein